MRLGRRVSGTVVREGGDRVDILTRGSVTFFGPRLRFRRRAVEENEVLGIRVERRIGVLVLWALHCDMNLDVLEHRKTGRRQEKFILRGNCCCSVAGREVQKFADRQDAERNRHVNAVLIG